METGVSRPHFSLPSLIAIGAAIGSFAVGGLGGFILAIVAIIFGVIGVIISLLPSVRGGVVSVFAMLAGVAGIIVAIFRAFAHVL